MKPIDMTSLAGTPVFMVSILNCDSVCGYCIMGIWRALNLIGKSDLIILVLT